MGKPAIEVCNISKEFFISQLPRNKYSSIRDVITEKSKKLFSFPFKIDKGKHNIESFWALKDVNFSVNQGERIGVIGRNGAGKSTMLKVLTRITEPTIGKITIRGRVASLLEVGTGFHPELTGRENIFLNGAILGMSRIEIKSKFDEIVSFAEVEKFLETPVKRYSSGMYVRLAFAVAAHLEPEILIVDEVLAVGDSEFQKKCIGKMEDVSTNQGRTVILVSHQMDAISRLCERVVILDRGQLKFNGETEIGIKKYLKGDSGSNAFYSWDNVNLPGNEIVRLLSVKVKDVNGQVSETIDIRQPIVLEMVYRVDEDNSVFTHGINIFNSEGVHVLSSHDIFTPKLKSEFQKGIYTAVVTIPGNFLAEGTYYAGFAIMSYNPYLIHVNEKDVVSFSLFDTNEGDSARGQYGGHYPGVVRPILKWNLI